MENLFELIAELPFTIYLSYYLATNAEPD
jgi:hypothetical protein